MRANHHQQYEYDRPRKDLGEWVEDILLGGTLVGILLLLGVYAFYAFAEIYSIH